MGSLQLQVYGRWHEGQNIHILVNPCGDNQVLTKGILPWFAFCVFLVDKLGLSTVVPIMF